MKKKDKRSRLELIIDELKCGGFANVELEEIIKVCEEEIERVQNESS